MHTHDTCPKSIETESVFNKTKMNSEGNINFLQKSPFDIKHTSSSEFSIG